MIVFGNILQPVVDVMEEILVFLHNEVGFGWGMSIVMLTVVVRVLILPLAIKQFRSMQAMQALQPQMKEIQAKYKDDRQRKNQEMMKFYQENKVNPFSSCLPLILQLPVFISLFYLLRKDLDKHLTQTKGWLFIGDLTHVATGESLVILVILYIGTQVGSSLLMMTTADKTQRNIMLFLPIAFVVFIIRFPAGLVVYWITTNVWTVGQQLVLKRMSSTHPATVASGMGVEKVPSKPPPLPPRKKKGRRR